MNAFDCLNRLKWTNKLHQCTIEIIHRGAENNILKIKGTAVTEVKKTYFMYKSGPEEIFIPNHRILRITIKDKILYEKATKR